MATTLNLKSAFKCDDVSVARPSAEQSLPTGSVDGPAGTSSEKAPRTWLCLFERFCRRILRGNLNRISTGEVVLEYAGHSERFGNLETNELMGHVHALSPRFFRSLVTGGALGAAESYLEGEWVSDDLTDLFRVLLRNESVLQSFRNPVTMLAGLLNRVHHSRNRNSRHGSRRNIHEHYDLGNSFFSLFLDPTMMYSSALFPNEQASLEEASLEKVDRVCRTLQLSPADHVLEIGTGWGTFAIHAAGKYGCRVTTTTISDEQFRMATQRVEEAGLSDRITILKKDYRDLEGQYDKLVSIEMIEAVGQEYLPEYFATCDRLLKENGAMMIQAITMPEQRYERYRNSVDFIQKYIFPGGFLPSVSVMQECIASRTSMRMIELMDFGMHYARTLRLWNERFHERLDEVTALGFDDRFIRMWRYYLCYCEAAFLERAIGVCQVMWAKPGCVFESYPNSRSPGSGKRTL
jgi:cyclopropane-fatty-acyl-phospholipid synthase